LMMDAEALEMLETFVVEHRPCGEPAISTAFSEGREAHKINVVKRCQTCIALVAVTLTKSAAATLLRGNAHQDSATAFYQRLERS